MTRRIIPCLDLQDGRVVKGVRFKDLKDQGDPVELAKAYAAAGADELVILDISPDRSSREKTLNVIGAVAASVAIPVTVGGGIGSLDDARRIIDAGAAKISVNSAAVANPDLLQQLAASLGSGKVVLSVDALKTGDQWEVVTNGGRNRTGLSAVDWCRQGERRGAGEILLTSIDYDGTGDGYDLELIRAVTSQISLPVIASGGAGHPEHLAAALQSGADAVLAASIFHEGEWTVGQVKRWLKRHNIPVNMPPLAWMDEIKWDAQGLVPVIVDASDGVRMLGYANREALEKTVESGTLWLFSRSRQRLWQKGETSGNFQRVVSIDLDCDADAVKVRVVPEGPTCHTGSDSCFFDRVWTAGTDGQDIDGGIADLATMIHLLERQIDDRLARRPPGSYVVKLAQDADFARRKVGEEAIELIIASSAWGASPEPDPALKQEVVHEAADLIFHLLALLKTTGIDPSLVAGELRRRVRPR